jgi:hypothetical protein
MFPAEDASEHWFGPIHYTSGQSIRCCMARVFGQALCDAADAVEARQKELNG